MTQKERAKLRKKADLLFSQYIKKRDKKCQKCGSEYSLDAHHLGGKSSFRLRYEPQTTITLCRPCHRYAHDKNFEFKEWIEKKYPKKLLYAEMLSNELQKPDYISTIQGLKTLL